MNQVAISSTSELKTKLGKVVVMSLQSINEQRHFDQMIRADKFYRKAELSCGKLTIKVITSSKGES